MAATQTSTAVATIRLRGVHAGLTHKNAQYNSGATSLTVSTCVFMVPVPDGATIHAIMGYHSTGALTCPVSYGIHKPDGSGSLTASLFVSAQTQGVSYVVCDGMPYTVSASAGHVFVTASPTPGTETASVKINCTVIYSFDATDG